ncbi:hypothetical protein IAT38_008356 [Cryptococcus sp. DSM 104549]
MPADKDTIVEPKEQAYDFFFYGTLCVSIVLEKVLGHKGEGLSFQDAVLRGYTRHCVKDETYPAIIDSHRTEALLGNGKAPSPEELNTRGTLVRGLSYTDVNALDLFEGTEYSRIRLPIRTLTSPAPISNLPKGLIDPTSRLSIDAITEKQARVGAAMQAVGAGEGSGVHEGSGEVEVGMTEAWAYVWSDSLQRLEPAIWSFEAFLQAKESAWNDLPSEWFIGREDQQGSSAPVEDSPRELTNDDPLANGHKIEEEDGDEEKVKGKTVEGYPDFGHAQLTNWGFGKGYVNLNHGSYGSPPNPVVASMHALSKQIEEFPDLFMRRSYFSLLDKTREQVAGIIGATAEEVVIVPNTTHGLHNILGNMAWAEGDVIVIYSTTYGAIGQMAKYFADTNPSIKLEVIPLTFPCSHASIVQATNDLLDQYNVIAKPNYTGQSKPCGKTSKERVRMLIVDAIASNPGVVYPWQEVVGVCKKYGVMSVVDAAHAIGQVEVDVKIADPDFWVSNCHKWLMSHRGGAVLYVPTRNQHLIRSTLPTSAMYESTRYPTPGIKRSWEWAKQYSWTGTIDWTPFFSITPAIAFRESLGGEERIMSYTHTLAVQGGKRLRKKWGTKVMENPEGELTMAMVNVELPHIPPPKDGADQALQLAYTEDGLFENNCFAATYVHDGKWWARFSAQVWNELSDFDYIGDVLEKICLEIKEGKHLQDVEDEKAAKEETVDMPTNDE